MAEEDKMDVSVPDAPEEDASKEEDATADDGAEGKPLLEQKLEVTGKRQRKSVTVYTVEKVEKEKFVVLPGKGEKLGELSNGILLNDSKNWEEMKIFHKLLFGTFGTKTTVRKEVREFSGYPDTVSQEQKDAWLAYFVKKHKKAELISYLKLLGIAHSSSDSQETLAAVLQEFLEKPSERDVSKVIIAKKGKKKKAKKAKGKAGKVVNGVKLPMKPLQFYALEVRDEFLSKNEGMSREDLLKVMRAEYNKLSEADQKKYTDMAKKDQKRYEKDAAAKKRKNPATKKAASKKKSKVTVDEDEEEDEEEEEDADDSDEYDPKETTKKNKRKPAKAAASKKTKKSKVDVSSDDSSDDDEPLVSSKNPTEAQLKKAAIAFLKANQDNLAEISKKKVRNAVAAKFPDADLDEKKAFLNECTSEFVQNL